MTPGGEVKPAGKGGRLGKGPYRKKTHGCSESRGKPPKVLRARFWA